jgi:glycosyltransferase involved in cell wall biosynthesis
MLRYPWYTPVRGECLGYIAPTKGMTYLPFPQEAIMPNSAAGTHGNTIRILAIGKFVPRKNHRLLVESLAALKLICDFHLTIVGEASTREHEIQLSRLLDCIGNHEMSDLVEIITNLDHEKIGETFLSCDLFVLASTSEPASISNLEAMAHGLPVICSNTNGTSNYIEDGLSGFLFEDNDRESLTQVLKVAMSSREKLNRMGSSALGSVRCHHSTRFFAERMNVLCGEAICRYQ